MKRFLILALAFLTLASCGDPVSPSPSDPSPSDPDEPVLTTRNITLNVWESETAVGFIEEAAEAFREKYPNIAIRVEAVDPDTAAEQFRNGTVARPDLFAVPHTDIRTLADELEVLPARNQSKAKETALAACVQAATVNGVVYGYPVSAATLALVYNKAVITEPPATWGALVDIVNTTGNKFTFPAGTAYYVLPFITMGRNRLFGPDGENAANSYLHSSPSVTGMELFAGLRPILNVPAAELTREYTLNAFASGEAAMCIAGSWDLAAFGGINFGIAPLPWFNADGSDMASPVDARVMLVSAWSEQPDEASAFADFLLTDAMQKKRYDLTGEIPSVGIPLSSSTHAAGFLKQMEYAFATPTIPEAERFWNGFSDVSSRIWDGANPTAELSAFNAAIITPEADITPATSPPE